MTKLNYYVEFKDSFGCIHHAIHEYNRISGIVSMLRDLKFPECDYFKSESPKRFITKGNVDGVYNVFDTKKGITIATFYELDDAKIFCESKNVDETYLDDMEETPWN